MKRYHDHEIHTYEQNKYLHDFMSECESKVDKKNGMIRSDKVIEKIVKEWVHNNLDKIPKEFIEQEDTINRAIIYLVVRVLHR